MKKTNQLIWPCERESHSGVSFKDRFMMIYGGTNNNKSITNHVYIFDSEN